MTSFRVTRVMDALKLLIELISYEWITNESYMHESILTKAIWKLWTSDYDNYFVCQSVGIDHYGNWKCLHKIICALEMHIYD